MALIEDDKGVVERPPPHVGQGDNLDDLALQVALDLIVIEDVVEGIVERPQIRVDLGLKIARQEAELLARLDGRAAKDELADFSGSKKIDRHSHGKKCLPRPRRPNAKDNVILEDGSEIILLAP